VGSYQTPGFNVCFCALENSKRISKRFPSPFWLFILPLPLFYFFKYATNYSTYLYVLSGLIRYFYKSNISF